MLGWGIGLTLTRLSLLTLPLAFPPPPSAVERSPAPAQVTGGGAWLCGAWRQTERPLGTAVLPQSLSVSAAFSCASLSGRRIQRKRRTAWNRDRAWGRRGQQRDATNPAGLQSSPHTDTIISGLDTELRRCTHWISPTKECRDRGERGGLYREGMVFCRRNAVRGLFGFFLLEAWNSLRESCAITKKR